MDINHNNNNFTNRTSNLHIISIENQIFHGQIPYFNHPSFRSVPFSPFHGETLKIDRVMEEEVEEDEEEEEEELGEMKEMMYKIAAMQPVDIDPATIHKPKRRNVRISDDPQSIAARHRRERISEKIRILQRLVPGGTKMDTATMLDEAICYVKFLKKQIRLLQSNSSNYNNHNLPCIRDWQASPESEPALVRRSSTFYGN